MDPEIELPRDVRVVKKSDDPLQRLIDRLLRLVSLGRMNRYLTTYVTTIGRTIYVPEDWGSWPDEARADILAHELIHVAQFERYGLVPMALAYLFFPVPIGFAWARMRLEREAYEETLRRAHARGGRSAAEALRAEIVGRFVGPDYLWMWPWPRSLNRWLDRTLDVLDAHARV